MFKVKVVSSECVLDIICEVLPRDSIVVRPFSQFFIYISIQIDKHLTRFSCYPNKTGNPRVDVRAIYFVRPFPELYLHSFQVIYLICL